MTVQTDFHQSLLSHSASELLDMAVLAHDSMRREIDQRHKVLFYDKYNLIYRELMRRGRQDLVPDLKRRIEEAEKRRTAIPRLPRTMNGQGALP